MIRLVQSTRYSEKQKKERKKERKNERKNQRTKERELPPCRFLPNRETLCLTRAANLQKILMSEEEETDNNAKKNTDKQKTNRKTRGRCRRKWGVNGCKNTGLNRKETSKGKKVGYGKTQ